MTHTASNEPLVGFSCVSIPADGSDAAEMLQLARKSWSFNLRNRITGALTYSDGQLHLTVEGHCDVVLPLVARVLADPRHGKISITAFEGLAARSFADWRCTGFSEAPQAVPLEDGPGEERVAHLRHRTAGPPEYAPARESALGL